MQQKYFLSQAPGSIEWYLIPVEHRGIFIEWCKCELYDEEYQHLSTFFGGYVLIDGQHNEREFTIV